MTALGARDGMGSHQSASMDTDEWLTPPVILDRLGAFDLDPCGNAAHADGTLPPTAARIIVPPEDGLTAPWAGRIWLNPPYGIETAAWLSRLHRHGTGTALIFARTETAAWRTYVWGAAAAVLFLTGRLHFYRTDGTRSRINAGAPSALIAYGTADADALATCRLPGTFVRHWAQTTAGGPWRW